jgi:polyhydroxybutyrate depolymerase
LRSHARRHCEPELENYRQPAMRSAASALDIARPRSTVPRWIAGRRAVTVVAIGLLASACSQASTSTTPPMAATPAAELRVHPSAGCSSARPVKLTLVKQNLTVDGVARWYLISTPPPSSTNRPLPVVLDFHGLAEGASLEAMTTQFGPLAQRDGFIAVFPEGTGTPVQWDTSTGATTNPDLDFVSHLLDRLEATRCVDQARIYATGLSDGAFMTSLLACALSNRIAAFAPVSGVQLQSPCATTRRVPILAFHGTADPILYFNGGVGTAVLNQALGQDGPAPPATLPPVDLDGSGYPATVAAWAEREGCAPDPVDTTVRPHVIHRVYQCPPGTAVEFYIILGGGHAWPGSRFSQEISAITGPTTFEINATTAIWAFFQRFPVR